MAQKTAQQVSRDRQDAKALVDAAWALRRLTDRRFRYGEGAMMYGVCEVMERSADSVGDLGRTARHALLAWRS